jgi:hypothetical protein
MNSSAALSAGIDTLVDIPDMSTNEFDVDVAGLDTFTLAKAYQVVPFDTNAPSAVAAMARLATAANATTSRRTRPTLDPINLRRHSPTPTHQNPPEQVGSIVGESTNDLVTDGHRGQRFERRGYRGEEMVLTGSTHRQLRFLAREHELDRIRRHGLGR